MIGVNSDFSALTNLNAGVLVALGILGVAQLVLAITAVVILWHTPYCQIRYSNRWGWTAIILLINIFGPVAFFLFGRRTVAINDTAPSAEAAAIVAKLYGGGQV